MPRRRSGNRVLGPYPYRGKFRVIVCEEGGEKVARLFATEKEANLFREDVEVELKAQSGRTVAEALAAYQEYMRDVKQNRPSSIQTTQIRLRSFFTEPERVLSELTSQRCHGYYQKLLGRVSERTGEQPSVDSQRNTLAEARTFLNWCVKPQQWLKANPLAEVTGTGRRRHGKPQLRIDEARRLRLVCHEKARDGDDGAVAVLVGLLMGLRAQEIVTRTARDLDDGGRILWVDANDQAKFSPKTKASRRPVPVWDEVRPYLSERTQGKPPQALLFPAEGGGGHWRDWVRKSTRRLCRLAQVPEVCAHSLRGFAATLGLLSGVPLTQVAAALGHESGTTTLQSYAAPGTQGTLVSQQALAILGPLPPDKQAS